MEGEREKQKREAEGGQMNLEESWAGCALLVNVNAFNALSG